jgi:nitrogen fixation protein NifX
MIKVAFASDNETQVNMHFGAAESFVIYDVSPGSAELVGVGHFVAAIMKGENKDKGLAHDQQVTPQVIVPAAEDYPPHPADKPPEDKVVAKLEFLKECAAVYAASIGTSSIKRLMMADIQPIIVDHGHDIVDLLNEVSLALCMEGGLSWVDKAKTRQKAAAALDMQGKAGWLGTSQGSVEQVDDLITSIDDIA